MYQYQLTIITPTYNRVNTLPRLYDSLRGQINKNFQWLIIDDGSEDNTPALFAETGGEDFEIEYHRKENGGKHTALNFSHPFIKGEWVCIVDSDDWLLPEAVEEILRAIADCVDLKDVKCLSFLRGKTAQDPVCKGFPEEMTVSNHIDFRINRGRGGDCCEVLQTDVLKAFPFPEYPGERFMSEGYLWNHASCYSTVYIPKILYICEYLEGGLSRSGRRLRIQCPRGGMDNCNSFLEVSRDRHLNAKTLIKETWLFICYGKFAGYKRKEIIRRCRRPELVNRNYIFGVLLYIYWRGKYK